MFSNSSRLLICIAHLLSSKILEVDFWLLTSGPNIIAHFSNAGSIKLCPPLLDKLPPMKHILEIL